MATMGIKITWLQLLHSIEMSPVAMGIKLIKAVLLYKDCYYKMYRIH